MFTVLRVMPSKVKFMGIFLPEALMEFQSGIG
jgi:hypothetical protein